MTRPLRTVRVDVGNDSAIELREFTGGVSVTLIGRAQVALDIDVPTAQAAYVAGWLSAIVGVDFAARADALAPRPRL